MCHCTVHTHSVCICTAPARKKNQQWYTDLCLRYTFNLHLRVFNFIVCLIWVSALNIFYGHKSIWMFERTSDDGNKGKHTHVAISIGCSDVKFALNTTEKNVRTKQMYLGFQSIDCSQNWGEQDKIRTLCRAASLCPPSLPRSIIFVFNSS